MGVLKDNFRVLGLEGQVLGPCSKVFALGLVNQCICSAFDEEVVHCRVALVSL